MRSFKLFMTAALTLGVVAAAQAELQNVEVGGSIRIRGNYFDIDDNVFGGVARAGEDIAFVEQRTRLNFKADFTDDVSTFIEFDSYDTWGEDFRSNFMTGIDGRGGDNVELYQAYIEVNNAWGLPVRTRIGRQEIELGSEWLIGNQDVSSRFTGLSFDGIRTTYATDMFSVDLLSLKLSETFADFADGDVNLYGIYGSYIGLEDWQFDLYWLYLMEDEIARNTGAPVTNAGLASVGFPGPIAKNTDIHTIGLRGAGTFGAFDLEAEVAYQFGEIDRVNTSFLGLFGDDDLDYDAFAFNVEAGYTFDMTWTPRIYLGAAFFEGGDDNNNGLFRRNNDDLAFNRLFSNWEYSEFLENTDLSNSLIIRGGISAMPTEKISLLLAASYFEVDQTRDQGGFLWWRNTSDDTLGWEVGLYGDYQYSEDLVFRAGYAHFFGDDGLSDGNFARANGLGLLIHREPNNGLFAFLNNDRDDADYNYFFWEAEISF